MVQGHRNHQGRSDEGDGHLGAHDRRYDGQHQQNPETDGKDRLEGYLRGLDLGVLIGLHGKGASSSITVLM